MSSTYIENNKEKEEVKAFVDKKTAFRMSIKEYLKEQKESNVMDVIEQVHKKANNIEGLFKEKESFYIGLAQKWVNMTFKYFWLFGISPFEETQLHVPLDSYILHAISDKDGKNEHGLFLEDGKWCDLTWSTIESPDQYIEIQKEIANGIKKTKFTSTISWENSAWIEQAKIEA